MSEFSAPAQSPLAAAPAFQSSAGNYHLSDDLARLCLPQEFKDSYRNLAWVNSICALFLVVGLVGLRPPRVVHKPLSEVVEAVPVIFTPPEDPPKTEPEVKPDEPEPKDTPAETPQVVTVVAAADPSSVAFAVPVQGAVAIADAVHLATAPPPGNQVSPQAMKFNPSAAGGGSYPQPNYPAIAIRNHYQGTVIIAFTVEESGAVTAVKVQKSSGIPVLDEAAFDTVKNRYRFPPGKSGNWYVPITFRME